VFGSISRVGSDNSAADRTKAVDEKGSDYFRGVATAEATVLEESSLHWTKVRFFRTLL
jgi:hypothetical protein